MSGHEKRHIAHLDIDTFFIAVERLHNPKLIGKPVLIGSNNDRGIVAACSGEARRFGIHTAMPMYRARRLCKEAIVINGDYDAYQQKSSEVTAVIRDAVPLFEKSAVDEFYIDLSGMDKFHGVQKFTGELTGKVLRESGLPLSWGLASNKLVSKVATGEARSGQLSIPFGSERSFLAPLSIFKIPGVGEKTGLRLIKMGVERVSKLAAMQQAQVECAFGGHGAELWRRANGIDPSPVVPYEEAAFLSREETFDSDTIDMRLLLGRLSRLTESLGFALRSQNRLAGSVTVKIRYSDFEYASVSRKIFYTHSDHVLVSVVRELFTVLFTRRVLVRLIGVRFSSLIAGTYQVNLFEDTQEMIKLYQAVDSIKRQFGEGKVRRG